MSTFKSFEELECWKAATLLRIFVSQNILKHLPHDENYALKNQLRRSSRSISDNIAEGFGRYHYQENIQACRIARGSLYESLNQVITTFDEGYIKKETIDEFKIIFENTKSLLNGYINYLISKKESK